LVIRVAINGFGRIGRMVFRAGYKDKNINFVAINDLTDTKTLAHLLKYDSVHGILQEKIGSNDGMMFVGSKKYPILSERDPEKLPWEKIKVDVVVESTGIFVDPYKAAVHLKAGAKKVIISAPYKCDDGKKCPANATTLVLGVNEKTYIPKLHNVISNGSCTTNCVTPILRVVQDHIGIRRCSFTTIHAYTANQKIVDSPFKDLRRARAAAVNIIPTSTGADTAAVETIPDLKGKVRGLAFRIPIIDGSVTDFTIETERDVTEEEVNNIFKKVSAAKMKGIIEYSEEELVSTDIIHNSYSAVFDSKLTNVIDKRILKLVAWYDNEWGYSCRVIDMVKWVGR